MIAEVSQIRGDIWCFCRNRKHAFQAQETVLCWACPFGHAFSCGSHIQNNSHFIRSIFMSKQYWEDKHYAYFSNRECEYFPCHKGADPENFNCLFCYCPLYVLGDRCGGKFVHLPNGYKDCSRCLFPHLRENYGVITERYAEILAAIPYPGNPDV